MSCGAQSLFAFRTLRQHGLPTEALHAVFQAIVVNKLSYASPAWWGSLLPMIAETHEVIVLCEWCLHVRLSTRLDPYRDKLYGCEIVSECRTATDFKCANNLCLPKTVKCDGHDQCGDGNDKAQLCGAFWRLLRHACFFHFV